MLEELAARFAQQDRRALARLITLVTRGEKIGDIVQAVDGQVGNLPPHRSRVVAVTGSAGVGKSTLVGKLIELLRSRGLRVAVLACDPQSPVSGGALLGDRFRMPSQPDDGVFIRSLAAASGHGAVAEHLAPMIHLLERFGFDVIILETVGAGQGDTSVHELADSVVLLLQPEAGDELQWEKAGVLEVADVVAVQKADLPGAESTEAQVRNMLSLSMNRAVPVLRVSAKTGEGMEKLWDGVSTLPLRRHAAVTSGADLLRLAQEALAERFAAAQAAHEPVLERVLVQLKEGKLDRNSAAREVLRVLQEGS
jgi:LAO/AO transport system ATPase